MIQIGVTGWGDHDSLYEGVPARLKLEAYASYFPLVELDSSFYAIPAEASIKKWIAETPSRFKFVAKAYQGMTGHQRGDIPFDSKEEMIDAYIKAFRPLMEANKLAFVLCQFPPWFDCQTKNVRYLRWLREQLRDFPCALEFRHHSWYSEAFMQKTMDYMREDDWIHSICDEPQIGERSVPFVAITTSKEWAFVRLHGRNKAAWQKPTNGQSWREVRYLYDYSHEELEDLAEKITSISKEVKQTAVVFNNNSGGHAASNAQSFISMLTITYDGLAPRQLNLFDE
ncbi:DUF72 domain-containing protein [Paenalkalicoccus suaedae]|uniref:DUF72 domain-containing protein n=1 Tax=Paenalkalicoccus suaedae TaxID=2592382 RepID=A0A859FFR6_9BACI|nr:DUF72 domain-containing protein [Paenalkalicoccus suaedae]QKS72203.1 DUF72 domain-containing protein [Paenalkalicoccus suaedae]